MIATTKTKIQWTKDNRPYVWLDDFTDVILTQNSTEAYVQICDRRTLSEQQRKMCYSLIHAISDFTGETVERSKEFLKLEFMSEHLEILGDKIFSLSDAPMSLVAAFQKYLIRFIIENDIPTKFSLIEYVDDISDFIYSCLINKKCVCCGERADLHHVDTVGMGNDRDRVHHLGKEVLPLCRLHHEELHTIGKTAFAEKWHIEKGIIADKTICRLYRLRE